MVSYRAARTNASMIILITFSTKEEPTSAGEHEYDATNPSVRSLVRSFRGRIVVKMKSVS